MDEPVANLDPRARSDFFETLLKLKKEGVAIFISSHVLAELDLYADHVTVLDGGKVVYSGNKKSTTTKKIKNYYICQTNDIPTTIKILKKLRIHFTYVDDSLSLMIMFRNEQQISKFQKHILNADLHFILFKHQEETLEQMYGKLVKKGSVDTMKK
jgi:ABC-2 type transport system ATP-binding protein